MHGLSIAAWDGSQLLFGAEISLRSSATFSVVGRSRSSRGVSRFNPVATASSPAYKLARA